MRVRAEVVGVSGSAKTVDLTVLTAPPTGVFTSLSSLSAAFASAAPGSVLALAPGSYGTLSLSGQKAAPGVAIRSQVPGAAKLGGAVLAKNTAGLSLARFDIPPSGEFGVKVPAGCDRIGIFNNYFHDGAYLLEVVSANGSVPGAPAGNPVEAPITNAVIRGNRFARATENAMRICNFRNVLIEENEVTELVESGKHVDGMQTFFGGDGMIYRRNYHHDTKCQQFFVKDGQAKNILVEDNLFVRNLPISGGALNTVSFTNVLGIRVRLNTIWNARPCLVVGDWGGPGSGIVVEDNVLQSFSIDPKDETSAAFELLASKVAEARNTFGGTSYIGSASPPYSKGNGNWVPNRMSPTSKIDMAPVFTGPAKDDYRLASGEARGVSWRPADFVYGY